MAQQLEGPKWPNRYEMGSCRMINKAALVSGFSLHTLHRWNQSPGRQVSCDKPPPPGARVASTPFPGSVGCLQLQSRPGEPPAPGNNRPINIAPLPGESRALTRSQCGSAQLRSGEVGKKRTTHRRQHDSYADTSTPPSHLLHLPHRRPVLIVTIEPRWEPAQAAVANRREPTGCGHARARASCEQQLARRSDRPVFVACLWAPLIPAEFLGLASPRYRLAPAEGTKLSQRVLRAGPRVPWALKLQLPHAIPQRPITGSQEESPVPRRSGKPVEQEHLPREPERTAQLQPVESPSTHPSLLQLA